MSNTAEINGINAGLIQKLDPEGKLNLVLCLQCGRCSSGCTMRQESDVLPHQINRMVVLGMEKQLLESKAIWTCASCHTCVSRCPMEVNTPELIDKLREMSKSAPGDLDRIRVFNDVFLGSVKRFGRAYEFGLMGAFKMRTRDFMSDLNKFPTMLKKGKMKLMPPRTGGKSAVKQIFNALRKARRAKI